MSVATDITQLFTFVGELYTRCDKQDEEIRRLRRLLVDASSAPDSPPDAPEAQDCFADESGEPEPVMVDVDALERYVARHKAMAAEIIRSLGL